MLDSQNAPKIDDQLAVQALLYAGGALPPREAQAFERLLGQDQKVRETLSLAVQVAYDADPEADVRPSPVYREKVRQRVLAASSPWGWLFRWSGDFRQPSLVISLGATVAAILVFAVLRTFLATTDTPIVAPPQVPVQKIQAPADSDLEDALREVPKRKKNKGRLRGKGSC